MGDSGCLQELPCAAAMARMAADGFAQGWHERNGGNASYRLSAQELEQAQPLFGEPGPWVPLDVAAPGLGGQALLATASGSFMQKLAEAPEQRLGIVELDGAGQAYRVLWGFRGSRPTSELSGHLLIHEARAAATGGAARVVYHAHPSALIALSKLVPLEEREVTRVLWKAMTECIMVFPEGIGVVGCLVPGSLELARASACAMGRYPAVLWAQHGLLASGEGFDDAFGLMHAIVKAAEVHLQARAANGGSAAFPNDVDDDCLRAIAKSLGLRPNEAFLDGAPR